MTEADGRPDAMALLFAGAGEIRARCQALDWAATPLGTVEAWPQSLRTAVGLCLSSGFPMLLMWGPELVQVYNDAFSLVLHSKHPTALGQRSRDCWPELWSVVGPLYQSVLDTGAPIFLEDQLFTPERGVRPGVAENAYFTFSYSAVPDEALRPAGILVTCIETTGHVLARGERERALERANAELRVAASEREELLAAAEEARVAVAESEAKFRFALTVADLGAWDLDLTTQRAWRSPRHDQIFGYEAALPEWTYEQFIAHVLPEDRPRVVQSFGGALAATAPWDFTCRIRRADGAVRWIAARGEPIRDVAGVSARLVGVVQDVTAEHEAEAALHSAVAAAEAASRAKSEFLAVMSHELRTPLNAIGGYAELIEMGIRGPVTQQQQEDLARIQRSQRHLLGLVNEVLNYAKLETGTVHYHLTDAVLYEAVVESEGLVAPQARAKGLILEAPECAGDLAVRADVEKLRQVFVNLLSNAIKFTDRGGRVSVTCAADGEHVAVRVQDTGVGIEADQLERIFEPFVQVRADLTRTAEGTGLGLAISRDLARGMGGDLTAESAPGRGSTFILLLPRA